MPIRPNAPGVARQPVQAETSTGRGGSAGSNEADTSGVRTHRDEFVGGESDPLVQSAMRRFSARIKAIFDRDAMGLAKRAAGVTSQQPEPTEAQRAALETAAIDLVKDLPVRALSPEVAGKLKTGLEASGVDIGDLGARKIGSLGSLGGDVAKEVVSDFKEQHPKSYYGLATGVAVGGAVYAYNEGSEALKKLGIKPEVTANLGQNTKIGGSASWGKKFSDFSGTLDATHKIGDAKNNTVLSGSVTAHHRDESLAIESARLGVTHRRGDANNNTVISGALNATNDGTGLDITALRLGVTHKSTHDNGWKSTAKVNAFASSRADDSVRLDRLDLSHKITRDGLSLDNRLKLDGQGSVTSGSTLLSHRGALKGVKSLKAEYGKDLTLEGMSVGYKLNTEYRGGRLYAEGRAGYDLKVDRFDASLSAGYTKEDLDIAITAGRNERQGNYVGVGLKWSF